MYWDQLIGKWKQVKGAAKQEWGKFTDDLTYIADQRDSLIGSCRSVSDG
jgi:uncharacterized protein YjbJ (UPF0337 family)